MSLCLPVCLCLNMPMCDPKCLVNCSLDLFVLHNFCLCICLACVTAVSTLLVSTRCDQKVLRTRKKKKSKAFQDFNLAYLTFEVSDSYTAGLFSAKLLFLDLSVELRGMSLST